MIEGVLGVLLGRPGPRPVESVLDDLVAADTPPSPMPSPTWLRWLAPTIPVASAFALALTRIEDPDAFTHLALGRHLVGQRGWPAHEPFSFPSLGHPYYNSEWLFDVGLFLAYLGGGEAGVILLKAALVALAVAFLWLDSRAWGEKAAVQPLGLLIRTAMLTALVLMIRHRFVERPDIALMVFLAFTIYALNAYLEAGYRWIVLLPVLQVVWANTHPSAVVGLVPFAAVLGGGVMLRMGLPVIRRWGRSTVTVPTWRQLGVVTAVLAGVLAGAAVNPHGLDALILPFKLADQPWFRQEVMELQPPAPAVWPAPYAMSALVLVSMIGTIGRLPLIPALLMLPFVRLGLSAVRFIFLLELVAAPIVARSAVGMAATARGPMARRCVGGIATAGAGLAVLAVVLTGTGLGPLADARKVPGFGVNEQFVPEAALRYLDERGIEGRLFNAFHFGGYIAWRDFPKRAPILDGRGHVEPSLLQEIHFARVYSQHFARLHARFGFEAAVMDYPTYAGDAIEDVLGAEADAGLASRDWALVYWDDVALVYLRRSGPHAAVVARDEYRYVKPANGATSVARALAGGARPDAVRAELRRNVAETGSSLGFLLLGHATPDAEQAIAAFERVKDPARRFEADQATALVHWRHGNLAMATRYYERALARQVSPSTLYNAGQVRIAAGDDRGAVRYLSRAQRLDPTLAPVYPVLIGALQRLGDTSAAAALGPSFEQAATRARVTQLERSARGLLAAGRTVDAGEELAAALKLDPRSAAALTTLGYVRMVEGRLAEAAQAGEAALAVEPAHAPAHRVLAEVARARGDETAVRRHLAALVRLSPRSYDAWQIRETLGRLGPGS
jgi:tetratricopeptide (TPR) repeat protein